MESHRVTLTSQRNLRIALTIVHYVIYSALLEPC